MELQPPPSCAKPHPQFSVYLNFATSTLSSNLSEVKTGQGFTVSPPALCGGTHGPGSCGRLSLCRLQPESYHVAPDSLHWGWAINKTLCNPSLPAFLCLWDRQSYPVFYGHMHLCIDINHLGLCEPLKVLTAFHCPNWLHTNLVWVLAPSSACCHAPSPFQVRETRFKRLHQDTQGNMVLLKLSAVSAWNQICNSN